MFDININIKKITLIVVNINHIKMDNIIDYMSEIQEYEYKEIRAYNKYKTKCKFLIKDLKPDMIVLHDTVLYKVIHVIK
jgi:hypothetical protein